MATPSALTSFKRVLEEQCLPLRNIQAELPDSQLLEGMNFISSAVFSFQFYKNTRLVLLYNLVGCIRRVLCVIFFYVEEL